MAKDSKPKNQKELIIVAALAILLGLGGGYAIGISSDSTSKSSDTHTEVKISDNHDDEKSATMHTHSTYPVPVENAPTVQLEVTEDTKSGYNVHIKTTNFTFAPENVNGENKAGEGHAHLYVDGEKVGRVYGNYFHYDGSFEGTKTFKVTLNANDHSDYVIGDTPIEASVEVTHDSSDPNHSHE